MFMQESLVPLQRTIKDMQGQFTTEMKAVDDRLCKIETTVSDRESLFIREVAALRTRVEKAEQAEPSSGESSPRADANANANAALEKEMKDLRAKMGQLDEKVESMPAEGTPPSSPSSGSERLAQAAAALVSARKDADTRSSGSSAARTDSLASSKFRAVAARVGTLEKELARKTEDTAQQEARHAQMVDEIMQKIQNLETGTSAATPAAPPPSPVPVALSPIRTGSSFGNGGFEQPLHWRETLLMRLESVERREKEQVTEVVKLGEIVEQKLRESMGQLQAISDNNEARAESLMEWTKFQLDLFSQKLEQKFDRQFGAYQEAGRLAEIRIEEGLKTLQERESAWRSSDSQLHQLERSMAELRNDAMEVCVCARRHTLSLSLCVCVCVCVFCACSV